jgi:hypothetical protein
MNSAYRACRHARPRPARSVAIGCATCEKRLGLPRFARAVECACPGPDGLPGADSAKPGAALAGRSPAHAPSFDRAPAEACAPITPQDPPKSERPHRSRETFPAGALRGVRPRGTRPPTGIPAGRTVPETATACPAPKRARPRGDRRRGV